MGSPLLPIKSMATLLSGTRPETFLCLYSQHAGKIQHAKLRSEFPNRSAAGRAEMRVRACLTSSFTSSLSFTKRSLGTYARSHPSICLLSLHPCREVNELEREKFLPGQVQAIWQGRLDSRCIAETPTRWVSTPP